MSVGLTTPQLIAIGIVPGVLAITVHEVAHGWAAKKLGDPTAARLGRLTLNPIKHIDPIGTILVPIIMLMTIKVAFGWAKPVPVTWENLRHPKRDMALVAAAGPAANLLMAVLWGLIGRIATFIPVGMNWLSEPLGYMAAFGIMINIILMVLNLLPVPPLDGGRVAVGLLPASLGNLLSRLEPYGVFIIVGLMLTNVLWIIVQPVYGFVHQFVTWLVGM